MPNKNYWYIEGRWHSVAGMTHSPMKVSTDYYDGTRRVYFGPPTTLFGTYWKARSLAKLEMKREPDLDLRVRRGTVAL